jgi:chorismate mutase-like protein
MNRDDAREALAEFRRRIDEIDRHILRLLNERTRVVQQIGDVKQQVSLPIYEPKREDEVFANVTAHNTGPLPSDAVKRVFERVIDEMRTVQRQRMLSKAQE